MDGRRHVGQPERRPRGLIWSFLLVTDIDGLTGPPEYRNGGLLIDMGVIVPRAPLESAVPHEVASELIVAWRALTVALLDRLREATRAHLGLATFSISQPLQGGTWSAGRAVAMQRRPPDGLPPIAVRPRALGENHANLTDKSSYRQRFTPPLGRMLAMPIAIIGRAATRPLWCQRLQV